VKIDENLGINLSQGSVLEPWAINYPGLRRSCGRTSCCV
jgi:hypothetical protein